MGRVIDNQGRVAEEFRGRVTSLYLMANIGGTAVGALTLGRLAGFIDLPATVLVACGMLASYLVFVYLRYDGLRVVNEVLDDPDELDVIGF